MEDWKLLEKVLNGKRVKMTDNGIIYANQNGSIYKTSLGLGQVRYIGEVYKGNVYLSEEVNEKEHIEYKFTKDIREETYRRLFFTIMRYINGKKWGEDETALKYVKRNIGKAIYNRFEYGEFFILNEHENSLVKAFEMLKEDNQGGVYGEKFHNIFFRMTGKELNARELIRLYHDNSYDKFIKKNEKLLTNAFSMQKFVMSVIKELDIEGNMAEYERQYEYAKKLLQLSPYDFIIVFYDTDKTRKLLDKIIKEWTVCRISKKDELFSKFDIKYIKKWKEGSISSGFCGASCVRNVIADKTVGKALTDLAYELFGARSKTPIASLGNKELEEEVIDYFSDMKNVVRICDEKRVDILKL